MSTLVKSSNIEAGARKVSAVVVYYHQISGSSAPSDGTGVALNEAAYDLANNKVYVWLGSSWVDITSTVFGQATVPNGTRIIHAITGESSDVTGYTEVQSGNVWIVVGGAPVVEKTSREGDLFASLITQVYVGASVYMKPDIFYTNDAWVLQGFKQSPTVELSSTLDTVLRIKASSITFNEIADEGITPIKLSLSENNLLVGNSLNQGEELTPANNSILVADGGGIPSFGTALPAGITASTPTSGAHVATKSYTDGLAAGFGGHLAVRVATTAVLPGTPSYDNGTGGVGATLTATGNVSINTAGIDGVTNLAVNDRVLVKNQASALQNGVYVVTTVGVEGVSNYVLTRSTDFDNSPTQEIRTGDFFPVQDGTSLGGSQWYQVGFMGDVNVVGTDSIVFTQFSGSGAASLASLSDVDVAGAAQYNVLTYDGAEWVDGQVNLAQSAAVTGTLPIANGGTNSSTALNSNRIMVSSGGAIVEAAALTDGQILIGSTGNAPAAATLTAGSGISITNGAGTITIAQTSTFTFVDGEVPSGDLDGVDTTYTLVNAPSPATSLKVYVNGIRQKLTEDYTLSGSTITFVVPPESGDLLLADYRY